MADCTHSTLYVRDGYMQAKPMHKCLFCENDALAARLAEYERLLETAGAHIERRNLVISQAQARLAERELDWLNQHEQIKDLTARLKNRTEELVAVQEILAEKERSSTSGYCCHIGHMRLKEDNQELAAQLAETTEALRQQKQQSDYWRTCAIACEELLDEVATKLECDIMAVGHAPDSVDRTRALSELNDLLNRINAALGRKIDA